MGSSRALWSSTLLAALTALGCATSQDSGTSPTTGSGGSEPATTSSSSSSGAGGSGTGGSDTGIGGEGGSPFPCGQDCSKIQTATCLMAVCNLGQYVGTYGACVIVEAPAGTACDDGQFCTVDDACDGKGACVGGPQNDCGMTAPECYVIACDETFQTCAPTPAADDTSCTPTDLCQVNGVCKAGECKGEAKDCSFSPLTECNTVACNPSTGACEGTADATKNGQECLLTGDLCMVNRTCQNGQCAGGSSKSCSALTVGCTNGVCDLTSGTCVGEPVQPGGACYDGIDQCHVGICDANSMCQAQPVADGTPCNDHNACTVGDVCTAGVCGGAPTTGCQQYFSTGFETCPGGWTFGGDWQCGTPSSVGPELAHGGTGVIATQLAGNYSNGQTWATTVADSPPISLMGATSPKLSFWTWVNTQGSTYDGFNLKVSIDGGATFTQVTSVTPAYSLTIASQQAWGGDQSALGWQNYLADLSSYVGHDVILRFAFQSSSATVEPGVYIDDLVVAEPNAIPLEISTASLPDAVAGSPYAATLARTGGSSSAAWSVIGGVNSAWVTIDPTTGALGGTPTAANLGPASVAVQIQELAVPGNVATKTFSFNVVEAVYFQSFEGPCPNGWTLAGDWQCGTPSSVGPATAFGGSQCLATQIAGKYNNSQAWATTVATSPDINLTGTTAPKLSFRMWVDSESLDGANLKISTDGGSTFNLVSNVVPAYDLSSIASEPAWGGHLSAQGWRLVQADLGAYAGQTIRLRFAFRSDGSVTYPGVYIDDVLVSDN